MWWIIIVALVLVGINISVTQSLRFKDGEYWANIQGIASFIISLAGAGAVAVTEGIFTGVLSFFGIFIFGAVAGGWLMKFQGKDVTRQ